MGDRDTLGRTEGSDASRLGRRALLRRAAIVGGVAWTAPLVVESLASPAGALTLSGCYRFSVVPTTSGCANAPIASGAAVSCLPNPSPSPCTTITNVTTGSINTYCLTVTQGWNGDVNNCAPTLIQTPDTIVFGINTGLGACECPNATIEAAAGTFALLFSGTQCYSSSGPSVTISADKKSVTFGDPGIGNWTRYSFVIRCT